MTEPSDRPKLSVDEDVVEELLQPQTFFSLWSASRGIVARRNPWYTAAEICVGFFVAVAAIGADAATADIAKAVRETSDKVFGFTGAVLGVLVAAFAILATIGQSVAVIPLAVREQDHEPSEIKKVALHFVAAFVPYLVFAAWYALVLLVGYQGGVATKFTLAYPDAGHFFACVFLGGVAYGVTRMLVVLGALISNVYTTFMLLASATVNMNAQIRPKPRAPSDDRPPSPPALPPPNPASTLPADQSKSKVRSKN